MKKILILGAGRSSSNLIHYLLDAAGSHDWHVRVGDLDEAVALAKIAGHGSASAFRLNADDATQRSQEVAAADVVVSMLPAFMHPLVAQNCLDHGKHLVTPSYVSDEMKAFSEAAREKGLLFLNEMGVDPGIDHMSAMKVIDHVRAKGGTITSFESFTGGLVAPESDNNPWHYKITWNPRNVVLAGQGTPAAFREEGRLKFIPYNQLFQRITSIDVAGYGRFEGYANRDSLKYLSIYGLEDIPTLFRGTLRKDGYCAGWNALVQLGLTDDTLKLDGAVIKTWAQLTASFLPPLKGKSLREATKAYLLLDDSTLDRLEWLGIFSEEALSIEHGSPAQALQKLIERKWVLHDGDKDMIVMWHRFVYTLKGKTHEVQSSLVTLGDDEVYTAMSKTVGLPIAIAVKFILNGTFAMRGVQMPVVPAIYDPVLSELSELGITFTETERLL